MNSAPSPGNEPATDQSVEPSTESTQNVGVGHVLDHVRTPEELSRNHVVEFRNVTKTYNAGTSSAFTATARQKIEAAGGTIEVLPQVVHRPKFQKKGQAAPATGD